MNTYDTTEINEQDLKATLSLWGLRAHRASRAHYLASETNIRWGLKITVANAIFSILVLFFANAHWIPNLFHDGEATIENNDMYIISVSLSSLAVVLLQIVQYLYRFEEHGSLHKEAASHFANLLRKIERYQCNPKLSMGSLHNINRTYNHITTGYPLVPKKMWADPSFDELVNKIRSLEAYFEGHCGA